MPTEYRKILIRGDTAANLALVTPLEREPVFATDTKQLYMGDGSTPGGIRVGFANPMTTAGDIIVAGVSGAPGRTGIGTAGQILSVVAGVPAWTSNISAATTFSNATAATNPTTGALIVTGGVGIAGVAYISNLNNEVKIGSTTTNRGEIQVGTVAVAGYSVLVMNGGSAVPAWMMSNRNVQNALEFIPSTTNGGSTFTTAAFWMETTKVVVAPSTAASSTSTGAFQVVGGVGIQGAVYIGGLASIAGIVGVGVAPATTTGITIGSTTLTGTLQLGLVSQPTYNSAATSSGRAIYCRVISAASVFTMTTGYGISIDLPTIGAGSAITTILGMHVANQGTTGVTNAIGIDIAAQSGAATSNVGLRNAGTTTLTNATAATSHTVAALTVTGGVGISGALYAGNVASMALAAMIGNASNGATKHWGDAAGQAFISNAWVTYDNGADNRWEWNNTTTVGGIMLEFPVTGIFGINVKASAAVTAGDPVSFVKALTVAATVITVTPSTASTSTTTGALVVTGGVGIGGSVFCGAITTGSVVGIGVAVNTEVALRIGSTNLTGTSQYGIYNMPVFTSSATVTTAGFFGVQTAAAAFAVGTGIGLRVFTPSLGAGSSFTTMYGLRIDNQGAAGITTSIALAILAQSGAGTNIGISCAAIAQITDATASTSSTTGALVVTGGVGIGGTLYVAGGVAVPDAGGYFFGALTAYVQGNAAASTINFAVSSTTRLQITTSGAAVVGSIATSAPTAGTAGSWKLGIRVAAAVAFDATQYVQLDIGGTAYKLALAV